MTYDQHALRRDQLLDWHERLGIARKEECEPNHDITPMVLALNEHLAYAGRPGPLTWKWLGGEGPFEGRGPVSMLIAYAMSVIELIDKEDFEPSIVALSNEGYVKPYDTHDESQRAEADAEMVTRKLGDYAREYAAKFDTRVREALMTVIISFPRENDDEDEPSYSLLTQPFVWSDGGELRLDPLPTEEVQKGGGVMEVGRTILPEQKDTNQGVAIKMIWDHIQERRAARTKEQADG